MTRPSELVSARAAQMMGEEAALALNPQQALAWEGLLEFARRLRHDAEVLLSDRYDLSISMLGVMGRLSTAPEHTLRQTALADAMGLSLSRISRVIDLLEDRALLERRACPCDGRATNVTLTDAGAAITAGAQRALFGFARTTFFDQLQDDEARALAALFTRLID